MSNRFASMSWEPADLMNPFHRLMQNTFIERVQCHACHGDGLRSHGFDGQHESTSRCTSCAGSGLISVERERV